MICTQSPSGPASKSDPERSHGALALQLAFLMFHEFMLYNPKNSAWFNRDRFTLSAGHGSMLQYAMLHFSGFDVTVSLQA